jgi:hypothetical protein
MALGSRSSRSAVLAFLRSHDQPRGGEEPDGDVVSAGLAPQGDGQMGLAGSHVPIQDQILGPVDETERQKVIPAPVPGEAGHAPIASVELLGRGEDRVFGRSQTPRLLPARVFGLEQAGEQARPAGRGILEGGPEHATGQGKITGEVHDLIDRGLAHRPATARGVFGVPKFVAVHAVTAFMNLS